MKKIKILFTIPNFTTAGSGREMFNIIERLDKGVFDPYIAVGQEGGGLYQEIIDKGYTVIVQPFIAEQEKGIVNKLSKARAYAAPFKAYKFDIWQSFHWSSDYTEALTAYFAGAKYMYVKKSMNWDRLAWKVKSFLSKKVVVRNTTLLEKYFSGNLLKNKAVFITGAVDTARFTAAHDKTHRVKYNIPAHAFLISCIAQIVKVKDQLTLIRAVAGMDNVFVILAGAQRDELYLNEVRSLIQELGLENRVLLAGSVSAVNELLNASDCFVLPTTNIGKHEEGCPVALIEAMATATPCIASDVAGSRDLVKHEETGLLFTPGDAGALALAIKRYMGNNAFAKQMGDNARKRVYALHTLEIEANAFADVYKSMMLR